MNFDAARAVTDFSGLAKLKAQARADQGAATEEVAQQFEALFVQMMLQRMREASFGGGLLDSQQSLFYRDLYDQQLASHLSTRGGLGLADTIKRQLGGAGGGELAATLTRTGRDHAVPAVAQVRRYEARPASAPQGIPAGAAEAVTDSAPVDGPYAFVRELWPAAERAASDMGVDPAVLLAQAALETGWGRHVMRDAQGRNSHNLFGIKADRRWAGDTVRKTTLEYKDGVALKTRADFRAYDSYEHAFKDYVQFIRDNPRYRDALQVTGEPKAYFQALQNAGYATDPAYADKITRIFEGPHMRAALTSFQSPAARSL